MTCSRIRPKIRLQKTAMPTDPADLATWVVEEAGGDWAPSQSPLKQLPGFFPQDLGEVQFALLAEGHRVFSDQGVYQQGPRKDVSYFVLGQGFFPCGQQVRKINCPRDGQPERGPGGDGKTLFRFAAHQAPALHLQTIAVAGHLGSQVIGIIDPQGAFQVDAVLIDIGDPDGIHLDPGILEGIPG